MKNNNDKNFQHDFTNGKLGIQILIFSIPLIFSNLLQVLFNTTDIAVVGQFAGADSLGAVGSTSILVSLFTTLLIGVAGGINVLVAQAIGAKKPDDIQKVVHTSAIISLILGILVFLVGLLFADPILRVLNTKPELIQKASVYLKIYFWGMPALSLYNFGNAVLSAAGDTKRPLLYLSVSGLVNLALNLLLVIGFKLDVAGVAVASVISMYLSAALVLRILICSKEDFSIRFHLLRIDFEKLRAILRIGIPSGAQNAIFQFANLFVQRSVNYFSATMVSGNSAAANADAFIYDIMAAFYSACACFIGQNFGAGKRDRVLKSYFISLSYSFGVGAVLGLLLILFGRPFLSIFTTDAAVVEAGMNRLVIMGFSYAVSAFMDCSIAASRGLGETLKPTFFVFLGSCVFRVIWIYTIFAHYRTIQSLYLLYVCSWAFTAIAEIIYFRKLYRRIYKKSSLQTG